MCIVVDTCALPSVFEARSKDHLHYRPVLSWVVAGRGKVVYGGTKYRRELRRASKYHSLLAELKREGKVVEILDSDVDSHEKLLSRKEPKFNDAHIAAIVIVSRCKLVCTNDTKAVPYLTMTSLYPRPVRRPKVYSYSERRTLLVDRHIAEVCRPAKYGSKELRNLFNIS